MDFSDFDMNDILENDFKDTKVSAKTEDNNDFNESQEHLSQFNLIFFTDGSCLGNGKQDSRNKAGFGIYIVSPNEQSNYHIHNDTKIIKKIDKEVILYNLYSYDINHISICNAKDSTENTIKCNVDACTYYAIYTDCNNEKNTTCKIHKTDDMLLNKQFFQFQGTNIRAEGIAILYALLYIKTIVVDKNDTKKSVIKNLKLDNLTNIKKSIHTIDFRSKSSNKYLIVSDSQFWIDVITKWSNSWVYKFTILEKKNLDINILINYYMNQLYDNGVEIVFQHVKGHSDKNKDVKLNFYQRGNVMADQLANLANKLKDSKLKVV
jgi:ribonuclease HI